MNNELIKFARQSIKTNLAKCTEYQHSIFRKLYSHNDLTKDINLIVDEMHDDKLDIAMQQVQRTVDKNEESEA